MPAYKEPRDSIRPLIRIIRGKRVILDADLARLYGVATKQFNQAFGRNRDRFPRDFAFRLTAAEFAGLNRSQTVTGASEVVGYLSDTTHSGQSATRFRKHRNVAYRPWAFNEHGALMAANILRSSRARQMSIYVIRAFVQMRDEFATNAAILKRLAEIDKTLLGHDSALRDLFRKLLPLLEPPAGPPKLKIGFHPGNR